MLESKSFLIGLILLFPVILHVGFNYIPIIPTIEELPSSVWLPFWGNYLGGAATIFAVIVTIKHTGKINRDSLNRQWKEKKYLEYKKMLLSNMELFNIVDIRKNTAYITSENVDVKVVELVAKRQSLYSCDLTYRIISEVDVVGKIHLKSETNYYNYWQGLYKELSTILDLQDHFLTNYKIQQHRNCKMESLMKSQYMLEQILSSLNGVSESSEYTRKLADILLEKEAIDAERKLYNATVNSQLDNITSLCSDLKQHSGELYSLTLTLLHHKELDFAQ